MWSEIEKGFCVGSPGVVTDPKLAAAAAAAACDGDVRGRGRLFPAGGWLWRPSALPCVADMVTLPALPYVFLIIDTEACVLILCRRCRHCRQESFERGRAGAGRKKDAPLASCR